MRHLKLALLAALVLSLSSCEMVAAHLATDFSIRPEPTALKVEQGSKASVMLKVSRPAFVDVLPLPIGVRLENPPVGVSAEDVMIEPGGDEAALVITVASTAPVGGPEVLKLFASNGFVSKTAELKLTVLPQ